MTMIERVPSAVLFDAEPSGKPASSSEPWFLDPREIVQALRPRWAIVLCPVLGLAAAALVWILCVPPKFPASTQILIDPRGLQVIKDGVTPADQASDASLLLVDSQIRVLTSDDVLTRVVERFDLEHDPEFGGATSLLDTLRARIAAALGQRPVAADPKLTALRALRERTGARRLERSFVVELGVTTEDREKSARLAQAVTETYLAADAETRAQLTRRAGAALSGRLSELQEALRQAEDRAQEFRAANNIVGTRVQLVSEQQLTQLSDQLGAARAKVAEQRGRLKQIEALAEGRIGFDAVTEVVQSATIGQLRTQLAQLEAVRADMIVNLGPRHPALRTSEVQVRSLRSQIDAEIRRIAAAARNEYKAALANEAALSATLDTRKREALTVGESFVRLRELERQVEASRAVYETFLVRARELQEQQRLDTSSSRIISPASPPARRQGPSPMAILAAALAGGLGVGILAALVAVPVTGRVGSRRRLEQVTGLPVIGALPRRSGPASRAFDLAVARVGGRLQREWPAKRPLAVVATSADDSCGKSALALGIASCAAAEGQRVLLVDADPEAALSRDLDQHAERTVSDVLRGRALLGDALVRLPSGIAFLPVDDEALRGGTAALAAALFGTGEDYDLIVVDAGLIGGAMTAEQLARDDRFSAVLFTVSTARSALAPIRSALEAIGQDARIRLVATDVTSES
ncbi:GumC family protein [Methylobacterium nodulans]|uniref:Lipopolysaccharide biosynthesis protein n=1 Tax=Methylobacterium nodulans (strain LMG 21967 / CNCM I-2342 / ORS 2060) TaxID=460265 RepID=B8IAG3_METNO|nr:exopolysaccharide transport family protein [Methylobacterium nodulans]ACL59226.1 lipopolysaccharide biosynthesis protein [Methylobacterium nodulans ORS 2060]